MDVDLLVTNRVADGSRTLFRQSWKCDLVIMRKVNKNTLMVLIPLCPRNM
jgi:hypothetical protein